MESGISLISTLSIAFGVALILGFVAEKLRFPALVGYLLAGILVAPGVFGLNVDLNLAEQLSEIGIMLLMFGVGLNFSLSELSKVKALVVPGALFQMSLSGLAGFGFAYALGWSIGSCVILGMCISCASTVVVLKALEAGGQTQSFDGHIAVGWLVVQDMVTVLMLVLLPTLASMLGGQSGSSADLPLWRLIAETFARVAGFIALMLVVGKRVLPWLLWQVAKTGSRELFTLCVLAVAIGIAFGASQVFNVSVALGAFIAGMVMRESEYAHRAATESLPLRDAFSVIFFVGVGMMFNPAAIMEHPFHMLGLMLIVFAVTPMIAFGVVLLFRYPLHTAFTLAACLGQIGEFSFILGNLGQSFHLLSEEGMNLLLAVAIVTIAINPLLFKLTRFLSPRLVKRFKFARVANARPDPQSTMPDEVDESRLLSHVVLIGFGPIGRRVDEALRSKGLSVVVVDRSDEIISGLRKLNSPAIEGDATDPTVLLQAHVQKCSAVIITVTDNLVTRKIIETAKILNPTVKFILRVNTQNEADMLREDGYDAIALDSEVIADKMVTITESQLLVQEPAKPA